MTIDEFVRKGIDELMAEAAAGCTEFTEASGALVLAFLDAGEVLKQAWDRFVTERFIEDVSGPGGAGKDARGPGGGGCSVMRRPLNSSGSLSMIGEADGDKG